MENQTPTANVPAPFGRRLTALIIDNFILCFPMGLAIMAGMLAFVAMLLVLDLYFLLFEYFRQATPGKMLLKLKVVSLSGPKLTFGQCLWREVFRHIDVYLIFPGFLSVLVTEDKQRLGDLVAKTQVVDARGK